MDVKQQHKTQQLHDTILKDGVVKLLCVKLLFKGWCRKVVVLCCNFKDDVVVVVCNVVIS